MEILKSASRGSRRTAHRANERILIMPQFGPLHCLLDLRVVLQFEIAALLRPAGKKPLKKLPSQTVTLPICGSCLSLNFSGRKGTVSTVPQFERSRRFQPLRTKALRR